MKKIVIISAVLAIAIVLSRDILLNGLLLFLFAGVVPGLNITLPFWVMQAFYCLLIAGIITLYVEGVFDFLKSIKDTKSLKTRLPKRRYSAI